MAAPAAPPESGPGVATLYRDAWGVPHIYADREQDGFYALGYAQAQDQLIGFLSAALAVEGRAGAVFGDGLLPWGLPVNFVEPATFVWRHEEEAKAGYARLPAPIRRNQEAWIAGFKAYMAAHPEKVPAWAPDPQPWHLIAVPRAILWFFMIGDGRRDCAKTGLTLSEADQAAQVRFASNEWAVAASHTVDGHAMVLSDPHSIINGSLFYEFRMKAGGLDVLGYTLATTMMLTHSNNVAWGMTTGGPDVSDCYALTLNSHDPSRYRIHGRWKSFESRSWSRTVLNKGVQTGVTQYADIDGNPAPVVGRADGRAYALDTTYFRDAGALLEQTDAMVRARDVSELKRASERLGLFPQNIMAADRAGSIWYLRAGRVPRRDPSIDWTAPVSGDDARTRWRGLRPSSELVQVMNPPTGYMQNDNTPPDHMVGGAPLVRAQDYPADVYNDFIGLRFVSRADRSNALLDAHPRFSVDEARRLAQDEMWIGAEKWTVLLQHAVQERAARVGRFSPEEARVLSRLLAFDGVASADSAAALNHYFWRTAFWLGLNKEQKAAVKAALLGDGMVLPAVLDGLLDAVGSGAAEEKRATGSVDGLYGDYFRISRDGVRSWPQGGGPPLAMQGYFECGPNEGPPYVCAITQRAMSFGDKLPDGRMRVTEGSRASRLVVFGDPLRTYSLHNYGQSDDPASPHYDDQARLLSSPRTTKSVPYRFEDLAPEVEERVVLHTGLADPGS